MSFIIHCRSRMAVELEVNGTGQGRWGCLGRSFQPLALIASAAEEGVSKTEAWLTERASERCWEWQLQAGWAEAQRLKRLCSPSQVLIHSFISVFLPSLLPVLLPSVLPSPIPPHPSSKASFRLPLIPPLSPPPSSSHPSLYLLILPSILSPPFFQFSFCPFIF